MDRSDPIDPTNQTWKERLIATDLATWPMQQDFDARGRLITETPQAPTPPDSAASYGNSVYQFAYTRLSTLPTWIPGAVAGQVASRRTITELVNGTSTTTRTNTFFYDGAGRLRAKGTPEGTIAYSYDAASGRLSSMKAYRAAYTLDSGGTETWGANSAYGPANPTLQPDVDVSYAYDHAGRLVSVTDNKLTQGDKTTTYVYDEGQLLGQRYPNGVTTLFKHDALGDLSDLEFHRKDSAGLTSAQLTGTYWTATPKASFRYTRDFNGQRRRSLDSLPRAGVSDGSPLKLQFQHKYDSAHRLDTEWVASDTTAGTAFTLGKDFNAAPLPANRATLVYAMNLVGNRGSRTKAVAGTDPLGTGVAPTVSTYAYDGQDRAITVGGTSPTWDKKDNALTAGNGKTYQWDRRNRLTASTTGGTTTTLGYDAEGLRVSKQVGTGTPTRYLVDTLNPTGYGQVLVEYTGDGASRQPVRAYTYGLDLISQRTITGELVEFFSADVLGTTRFLTKFDPTPGATGGLNGDLGEITTQTFNFDAYGTLTGSTTATAYLYTGEQWDAEVGAYYLRARWYLPEWGRFLSRDTYHGEENDPISQNRFVYVGNNPTAYVDPSGNDYTAGGALTSTAANNAVESTAKPATARVGIQALRKTACVTTYVTGAGLVAGLRLTETLENTGGHHGRQKAFRGARYQHLAHIAAELHMLFHRIAHKYAQEIPELKGLNTYSGSREFWEEMFDRNPKLVEKVYQAHLRAATTIDRLCRYKGPMSFRRLTELAWGVAPADLPGQFNIPAK